MDSRPSYAEYSHCKDRASTDLRQCILIAKSYLLVMSFDRTSKSPSCVRVTTMTEVVVSPKPRIAPLSGNTKAKSTRHRILRILDLKVDPCSVCMPPLFSLSV